MQYSLRSLLTIVALAAFAFLMMRSATAFTSRIMFTLAAGAVGFALLWAIFGLGPRRAGGSGFALCAAAYLTISTATDIPERLLIADLIKALYRGVQHNLPPPSPADPEETVVWLRRDGSMLVNRERVDDEATLPELLTAANTPAASKPLRVFYDPEVGRDRTDRLIDAALNAGITKLRLHRNRVAPQPEAFAEVCHRVAAILLGALGGLTAAWIHRTTRGTMPTGPSPG